jgi:hypothetical protein
LGESGELASELRWKAGRRGSWEAEKMDLISKLNQLNQPVNFSTIFIF